MYGQRALGPLTLLLAGFWIAQAIVAVVFKYGASHGAAQPAQWWICLVAGNAIGVASAVLWMAALRRGSANVVAGLAVGGAFLAQQLALLLTYRGSLTPVQSAGIAAIVVGMFFLGWGARRRTEPTPRHGDRARAAAPRVPRT